MREFMSSVKILLAASVVLAVAACSIPLGAPTQAANLSLVVQFPASQNRSLLAPETTRIEVTVSSPSWSSPQTFTFDRAAGSTEMTLTIPGVPLGDVVIDLVASGQVGTDLIALSSGHAEAKLSASNKSVSIQILPVAPVVQTEPVNDLDTLPETPSAPFVYGATQTTFFKVAPTTPGLYRIVIAPGTTAGDVSVPAAFMQIYDSDGNVAAPPRFDVEELTFWYIQISDVSKPYYVGLRAGTGSDNGLLLFDEATTADLTSAATQTPEGEIDTTGTLVFTFPYDMDTAILPGLTVFDIDDNKAVIATSTLSKTWVNPTRLEITCAGAGWPVGKLGFQLTGLVGQSAPNTVTAGAFNGKQFLFWQRDSWQSIYVDPLGGSDANSGKVPSQAIKSLNKIFPSNFNASPSPSLKDLYGSALERTRILLSSSAAADNTHNALMAGTQWLYQTFDAGGVQILGGRNPNDHWKRIPGAYTYLGFDGDDDSINDGTNERNSLRITLTGGSSPLVLEGLDIVRNDQSGTFTTPEGLSSYAMAKVTVNGTAKVVVRDNLFDAGYLHYTTGTNGAQFVALKMKAPKVVVARNSIRNRASTLTDSGAYAVFIGMWLYDTTEGDGPWIVANNTLEPGGLDGPVGANGGGYVGLWVNTPGQPTFVTNNSILVPAGQNTQSNGTREGIRGTANGQNASTWIAANNLIVFLDSPSLWYHQYLGTSGSAYYSFTSVRNNLFVTDSTLYPDFGGPSGYLPSSVFFYYNLSTPYATISALNAIGEGFEGNGLSSLGEAAPLSVTSDFVGTMQPGGFALQSGSIETVKSTGWDLSDLASDYTDDEYDAFMIDRLGNPHNPAAWSIGAYEQD